MNFYIPPITKNLLIINILCFVASFSLPHIGFDIENMLGLHYFRADKFNLIQLVTYMFFHADFTHLFFNMFSLWMFGRVIEELLGAKRYLTFYFVCGLGAAITQELTWAISIEPYVTNLFSVYGDLPEVRAQVGQFLNMPLTIGASGAVFGLLLAFGMMLPNQPIYMMFIPIPIKAKYFVIGYAVIELLAGVAPTYGDNVAHFAHLGGMVFGFFLLHYWRKKSTY